MAWFVCFTLQRTTPLYIKEQQLHITFLRIVMLALTHSLLRSPFTLFLPPQSDVADMLAVSRRTILIVFVFVFVFGAYHSNRLAAQLDAPAEVRFVKTSKISRWCQTFATWFEFLQKPMCSFT